MVLCSSTFIVPRSPTAALEYSSRHSQRGEGLSRNDGTIEGKKRKEKRKSHQSLAILHAI